MSLAACRLAISESRATPSQPSHQLLQLINFMTSSSTLQKINMRIASQKGGVESF